MSALPSLEAAEYSAAMTSRRSLALPIVLPLFAAACSSEKSDGSNETADAGSDIVHDDAGDSHDGLDAGDEADSGDGSDAGDAADAGEEPDAGDEPDAGVEAPKPENGRPAEARHMRVGPLCGRGLLRCRLRWDLRGLPSRRQHRLVQPEPGRGGSRRRLRRRSGRELRADGRL